MAVDLSVFINDLEVVHSNRSNLRIEAVDEDAQIEFRVTWNSLPGNQFEDRPFGSQAHLDHYQRSCDGNFAGTCALSAEGAGNDTEVWTRVVRDRDGAIMFENQRLIGQVLVNVFAVMPADSDEGVVRQDFLALVAQVETYFQE